jgi:hypothetical protein
MKQRKPSRLTISFTEPQRTWLTDLANRWGLSMAEAVRRLVDERMSKGGKSA